MTKKKLDELNEEIQKAKCECCDHDHEEHEGCDCGCEDMYMPYDFEPVHNSASFANIFSIVSKVIAVIYFIVGTYNSINSLIYYHGYYEELGIDFYVEFATSFFTTVILITFAFVAIGEIVNLLNRIKESLY